MAKNYTKTLTLNMADGSTEEYTGAEAVAIIRRLDDDGRILKIADGAKVTYLLLSSDAFVQVASYTTGETEVEGTTCENPLPNCPVVPTISLDKTADSIAVAGTTTLTATTAPDAYVVSWSSSDEAKATVAGGVVTGVAAGEATITASITVNGVTYTATATITVTGA